MTDEQRTVAATGETGNAGNQWPVYQVFERPSPGDPMQAAGSVHAPDPEMALQNARDVYGRRPTSIGLWVVPRLAIFSKTKEELAGFSPAQAQKNAREQTYCVFCKRASRVEYQEAKPIRAMSAEQAITRAAQREASEQRAADHPDGEEVHSWWVFPSVAIICSEPSTGEPFLKPRSHKWFRDQKSFPVLTMLRQLRAARKQEQPDDDQQDESE
jgi:ring-1,2-phenylacetyl-CoA epoxidase subunit PaaB